MDFEDAYERESEGEWSPEDAYEKAKTGSFEWLRCFGECGGSGLRAIVSFAKPSSGWTCLHQAAFWGDPAACQIAYTFPGAARRMALDGKRPADVAQEKGHQDLADQLKMASEWPFEEAARSLFAPVVAVGLSEGSTEESRAVVERALTMFDANEPDQALELLQPSGRQDDGEEGRLGQDCLYWIMKKRVLEQTMALRPDQFDAFMAEAAASAGVQRFFATQFRAFPLLQSFHRSQGRKQEQDWPPSSGLQVNMMPFKLGEEGSLPENLRPYWPFVMACRLASSEDGKIAFISVQESDVAVGATQRRPGLHIERPAYVSDSSGDGKMPLGSEWGCGVFRIGDPPRDGVYMASNVSNSCEIWEAEVSDPTLSSTLLGGAEHLREAMAAAGVKKTQCAANAMYWITDRVPHEALPTTEEQVAQQGRPTSALLSDGGGGVLHRQYFRLVCPPLSHWFVDHNTPNPLGVVPNPAVTALVQGNKFGGVKAVKSAQVKR